MKSPLDVSTSLASCLVREVALLAKKVVTVPFGEAAW